VKDSEARLSNLPSGFLVVLLALSVFSLVTFPFALTSAESGASVPSYVFKGAYAVYELNYSSYNISGGVVFQITSVNVSAGTFKVFVSFTGDLSLMEQPGSYTANFSTLYPLPAVNSSSLEMLNEGRVPPIFNGSIVTPNVYAEVPAGRFEADEVYFAAANATVWVDRGNGLILKEIGGSDESPLATFELGLEKTNMMQSGSILTSPYFYLAVGLAAVAVVLVVIVLLAGRGAKPMGGTARGQPSPSSGPVSPPSLAQVPINRRPTPTRRTAAKSHVSDRGSLRRFFGFKGFVFAPEISKGAPRSCWWGFNSTALRRKISPPKLPLQGKVRR